MHQGAIDVLGPVVSPSTVHQSKFSMGTVLALAARHGHAGLTEFDRDYLAQETVALRDKVSMELDAEVDGAYPRRWIGKVSVQTTDGRLLKGERFKMMATNAVYNADNLGVFTPANEPRDRLNAGEVGYIIAGIKELKVAKVGDTITLEKKLPNNMGPAAKPLPGFKEVKPQVFAGLYPTEASEYDQLRDALENLTPTS